MLFKSVFLTSLISIARAVPSNYHHGHLHWHARRQTNSTTEYDYVVIGSGAGGGPLASRLAIAGFSVLIIEAGDDQGDSIEQQVPAMQLQSTEYEPMAWSYFVNHYDDLARQKKDSKMVYQKSDGGYYVGLSPPANADPLGILYPRSGTLGGCTAHNAMVTIYPFESDWSYIQTVTGNDSWAPDHMRTYFEKLERCRYLPNSVAGHGFDGWLTTFLTPLTLVLEDLKVISLVLSAASAMGKGLLTSVITTVTGLSNILLIDLNNPSPSRDSAQNMYQVPIAVDPTNGSKRSGPRDFILDTANAVNADGSRKYHLDVQLRTLATKIRFQSNSGTPRAVGVEYMQGQSLYAADPRYSGAQGTTGYVGAKKEVIISAGAFNTPQLLKLSGIGPREELSSFGIDVVSDLPGVGTNLQDRYETGLVSTVPTDFFITKDCTFGYSQPDPCLEKWQKGLTPIDKGTYVTNGIAIGITKKTSGAAPGDDPDILVTGVPGLFRGYYPGYAYDALIESNHWTWITLKAHSHNNGGTVRLRSTDPQERPQISFNYFDTGNTDGGGDLEDLQAVYEGMLLGREMYQKLIPLDGKFTETWPGPKVTGNALKTFIKNEAWGHHASCTAPIGADNDPMAVLDSDFRVRGVDSLRVVDASVFPKIPGTYIAVPIYMISEKAADVIINA